MIDKSYSYNRLDGARRAFRLVRLVKGYHPNPVHCEIFQAHLHDIECLPYEALSYTWGGQLKSVNIIVSEGSLKEDEERRKWS